MARDRTDPDGKPIFPPHDSVIEQAVLGAILSDNDLLEVCQGLEPEHFFEPFHRQLFGIVAGMIRHGQTADLRTLNAALAENAAPDGMTGARRRGPHSAPEGCRVL
jgi:replicative DNA helicase